VVVKALSGENTYEINAQALNKAQTSGVAVTHEQSFPTESIISSLILPKQQQLFFPLYADGAVVSILVVAIPQSRFDYFTGHHYNLSIYILTLILVGLLLFYYLTKYISKDHRALELYIDRLSKGDIPAIPSIKQRKLAIGIAKLRKSLVKVSRIDKNLQDRSHDIYNKVYNIQTTADNILKTKDINQQQRFISNIQQDAIDLEESIEKILLQAKGDQRENLSSPELVSSMNLVTDVLGDSGITNALEKKKINIKTSNLGIEMKVEYNDVYSALINLIHNAITATDIGTTIEVKLQHTNKWIRLCVLDMGPGITHNFSLDSYLPNSSDKKSHGLGLPLVMRVMQRHEGLFELKNRPMKKGAEAILKFPKY
jgi:signal transduction histidine kinase